MFTIAYAYLLSRKSGSSEYMTFEMLKEWPTMYGGHKPYLATMSYLSPPVVKDEHFLNAVPYLVRRAE